MTNFFRNMVVITGLLLSSVAAGTGPQNREACTTNVLTRVLEELRQDRPGFISRTWNFNSQVDLRDRTIMRELLDSGAVRPGSIQILSRAWELSPEIGPGHALVRRNGRTYLVERTVNGEGNLVPFPAMASLEVLPIVSWNRLSETERARLNEPEVVASSHYRAGGQTVFSPLAVVMPTGHVFTRVDDPRFRNLGVSWQDEETGLIWSSAFRDRMNWDQACEACRRQGGRLPSRAELERWVSHLGRNENRLLNPLFPRDTRWFWSSSVHPDVSDYAYGMYGDSGYVGYYDPRNDGKAVRCVRSSR